MAIDWNKVISAEVLTTSCALIFAGGVAYATLANGQETADLLAVRAALQLLPANKAVMLRVWKAGALSFGAIQIPTAE